MEPSQPAVLDAVRDADPVARVEVDGRRHSETLFRAAELAGRDPAEADPRLGDVVSGVAVDRLFEPDPEDRPAREDDEAVSTDGGSDDGAAVVVLSLWGLLFVVSREAVLAYRN